MKEKVILNRTNGEVLEKDVICFFKSIIDTRPNIKGVNVLVVDKKETNNANQVLEFFWEKDGVYQPILDDAAWSEVKATIIDIIHDNFEIGKTLEVVNLDNVTSSLNDGRSLAIDPIRVGNLKTNFKEKIDQIKVEEEVPQAVVEEKNIENDVPVVDANNTVNEMPPVEDTIVNNEDVANVSNEENIIPNIVEEPISNIDSDVVNPFPDVIVNNGLEESTNIEPVIDNKVEEQKVITNVNPYQTLSEEIDAIEKRYNADLESLNQKRIQDINDAIKRSEEAIVNLKEKASEHLKNAQAAEQIATIAYNNAQNININ